jgi:hypothetical protein
MSAETITTFITTLLWVYLIAAAAISAFAAFRLEGRLKARLPATRPYLWGFYCACMGIACGPVAIRSALGMAMAVLNSNGKSFSYWFWYSVWLS